jgi:hypothetical protein
MCAHINVSAPQVVHQSYSNLKDVKPLELIEHDSHFDHALINQYLWHSTPLMLEIDVGSKDIVAVSINHLHPPIQDSSTHQLI